MRICKMARFTIALHNVSMKTQSNKNQTIKQTNKQQKL